MTSKQIFLTLFLTLFLSLCLQIQAQDSIPPSADTSLAEKLTLQMYNNVQFFPEYHIAADISMFFFQKDAFLKKRAFIDNNTFLDFELLRHKKISSVWQFNLHTGMGKTPGNVVFDPMDMNFAIIPTVEWRPGGLLVMTGVDHHCFHEIDRKDFKTVYWNKVILNVGSTNLRPAKYWSNLTEDTNWTLKNRLSWNVGASYYMRDFFGIVAKTTINGENKNITDLSTEIRWAIYKRRGWIINAKSVDLVGYYEDTPEQGIDKGVYWRTENSAEFNFRKGRNGGMFFVTYTLDKMPKFQEIERFSHDQLLQLGVRFFM
jgi:hypothetical protein